jgi:hypothetical protein
MIDNYSQNTQEPKSAKIIIFIQSIWPSVYRIINDIFFGTIHFIVDTLSGLWRR